MAKTIGEWWTIIAPQIEARINENGTYTVRDTETLLELNPRDIDDKIVIFERQVKGWFLDIAKLLQTFDQGDFVILMIGCSYVEGIEQTIEGVSSKNKSNKCFIRGFKRIFGHGEEYNQKIGLFYDQVRNGLFHNGMTKNKVTLNRNLEEIVAFIKDDEIKVNPRKFLEKIEQHFQEYIIQLKNPANADLRKNFDFSFTNLP